MFRGGGDVARAIRGRRGALAAVLVALALLLFYLRNDASRAPFYSRNNGNLNNNIPDANGGDKDKEAPPPAAANGLRKHSAKLPQPLIPRADARAESFQDLSSPS